METVLGLSISDFISVTVRIMPLKAFNVPVWVSLSLKVRHKSVLLPPHSTFYHLLERDSWSSWDTGEWSMEPPKSVSGTGTAGTPPPASSSTQQSYPPEPATGASRLAANDTEPASCDESPIIRQWSSDKWWQNGPGLSLSAVWHGVMVFSVSMTCWEIPSPRVASRRLMFSHLHSILTSIWLITIQLSSLARSHRRQVVSENWPKSPLSLRSGSGLCERSPSVTWPIDVISGSWLTYLAQSIIPTLVTHVWLLQDQRARAGARQGLHSISLPPSLPVLHSSLHIVMLPGDM